MCKKISYIRIHKFMTQKRKSLFIPIKVQLITNSSVIPYISETNNTNSSLKKKQTNKQKNNNKQAEICAGDQTSEVGEEGEKGEWASAGVSGSPE